MGVAINPQVLAVEDALRRSGIRTFLTQRYQRGGPVFLAGKDGRNAPLMWVNEGDIDSTRPQISPEQERWMQWLNYGQSPTVPTAIQVQSPADAVTQANTIYVAGSVWPTSIPVYTASTGPADAFQNAFRKSMLGDWNNFAAVDATRFEFSDAPQTTGVPSSAWPFSAWLNCIVKNGDTPARAEVYNADSTNRKIFEAGDTADISFEVSFPSDFPAAPTARCSVMRMLAFTNGTPPLEFLVKKSAANVDTLYLRLLGSESDLAGHSTLDAAGGYFYSTPLVRASSYSAMNWFKFTLRIKFATDSTGWVELYKDYNFAAPVMARQAGKTMTDTSGTVKDYARFGLDRHSSITGDMRIIITNCRYTITRP